MVIVNGLPYVLGVGGSALVPLSGAGAAIPLTSDGVVGVVKAVSSGAAAGTTRNNYGIAEVFLLRVLIT